MKRMALIMAFAVAVPVAAAEAQEPQARAIMIDSERQEVGTVTFDRTSSGLIRVFVEATGLPPGPHGFHVHETGDCNADDGFESAGGHFAHSMEHGVLSEGGPHPGDFPNVHVGQDGLLKVEFFTDRLSLDEGADNTVFDEDGSAVVIHADPDDYESQPSGEAGDRLACGIIEKAE